MLLQLGSIDKFVDMALFIRGLIQRAYNESKELSWPPTSDYLEIKSDVLLPGKLVRFLTLITAGTSEVRGKHEQVQRLVISIGQEYASKAYSASQHHPAYVPKQAAQ